MADFRVGYLYSLAPIHCGGEGDLGNILEIAREVHTNFPYIPGSSLRGSLRDEVKYADPDGENIANRLFGKELDVDKGEMGVHQVWFGDARLLWVPMRTMSLEGSGDAFTWVSCHSLIRDHALVSRQSIPAFRKQPVGTHKGTYWVADSKIEVELMNDDEKTATQLQGNWADSLQGEVKSTWDNNRLVLPDSDFEILMEHSLWTQIRNKIQDKDDANTSQGSAEVFWTDVCIPRDTIFYFSWGYNLLKDKPDKPNPNKLTSQDHQTLMEIMKGLLQVGGQANVGRGWVQSWTANPTDPTTQLDSNTHAASVSNQQAVPVEV
jgi:CRISPR-associated protein Cmr4